MITPVSIHVLGHVLVQSDNYCQCYFKKHILMTKTNKQTLWPLVRK
jgi:hypothetical protein